MQETIFGPSLLRDERHDRDLGEAHVLLAKSAADATISYGLSGRLTKTDKNWVMLSVPNALVRGAFDALHEIGAELPLNSEGRLNGHISVFRPDEIEQIGGADKLTELGHQYHYTLGPLKTCEPDGWKDVAQVWMLEVRSPELSKLRRSYGLSDLPKYPFHLTIAKRMKGTIAHNSETSKSASHGLNHYECPHCKSTNAFNGDPETGMRFRGSGHCQDCNKGFSIVGARLKPISKSAAHEYLQQEMVDDLENIQRDDELTKLAGWLGMFDDADVLKLAGLDEAIATDEIGRNPVELLDESGFAGDFVPGRDDSSQLEALAVLLGLTATGAGTYALVNGQRKRKWRPRTKLAGVYEHLPKIRGFDSVAGAIPGAALGSAVGLVKERLTKPKQKRNYFRAAATGAGVGGILGAGAGNVIGDRTRRYLTNTVPVIGSGYDNKENVSAVSPFKVGPDGGREVDWHKLYEGAILDRPVVSTNKADVLAEGADRSTANRAVRYELFRRQLGVHANRPGDLLSGNRDGSYSLSPSSPAGTKAMELLLPPDSRQTDLRAWLNKVNDVGGSGVGAGLFRDVMGGQVVTTSPFGDRDLVNQLDRWDYSLRPNEKSLLLRGLLAKTVGDREFLERKAEPKIDYTRAGDKVDGQVDSLAKRWMMDNVVVDHNPWLKHRFLIDKFDGNTPISVRPMTGDGRKYEGGDWKYRWDATQGKYVLER